MEHIFSKNFKIVKQQQTISLVAAYTRNVKVKQN